MLYFIIAALIVMLDQMVKYFITLSLTPGVPVPLIPGIIRLSYYENTGAAFSFMSDMRWVLVIISAVVIVLIVIGMIKYRDKVAPVGMLALSAVLGGALSHLFDRAVFGYVVDFFEFEFVRFAVFDVADCFITVGGIVFCIYYLVHSAKNDDLRKEFMIFKRTKSPPDMPELKLNDETPGDTPEGDDGANQT